MNLNFERKYIYDVIQRILHWWLALATLLLIISGLIASNIDPGSQQAYLWSLHIDAGKFLSIGFTGRIVWGLIGPKEARFESFVFVKEWISSLKTKKMLSADLEFGHHPQASLSYLGFYALIAVMVFTGFVVADALHGEGPLAAKLLDDFRYVHLTREIHEYGWWAIGFFIITHIAALMFHEWHDKIPLAQSMISGFQYRTKKGVKK